MYFRDVAQDMLLGKKIAREKWLGYWEWDDKADTIMMHCQNGLVLDIRQTEDVAFTLKNMLLDDWKVIDTEEEIKCIPYTKVLMPSIEVFCGNYLLYNPSLNAHQLPTPYGTITCEEGDKIVRHYTGNFYVYRHGALKMGDVRHGKDS